MQSFFFSEIRRFRLHENISRASYKSQLMNWRQKSAKNFFKTLPFHLDFFFWFFDFLKYFFFQVLECRVCDNVFGVQGDKIPRLLFCGHTFCHSCLSRLPQSIPNLIETESGSEVSANIFIQCPFDRQPTTLGTHTLYMNTG